MINILIADDSGVLQDVLTKFLQQKGYNIATAPGTLDAPNSIDTFQPDIILLNACLDSDTGLQLCKTIQLQNTGKKIPLVLFAANLFFLQQYADCNATAIIEKPFELSTVANKIRGITGTSEHMQQQTVYY